MTTIKLLNLTNFTNDNIITYNQGTFIDNDGQISIKNPNLTMIIDIDPMYVDETNTNEIKGLYVTDFTGEILDISSSFTYLFIGCNVHLDYIPKNINVVIFNVLSSCQKNIFDILHNNIKKIYFNDSFDQNIDFLPSSVTHLHLGISASNKSINNLHNGITHLHMETYENVNVPYLPNSLKHLTFLCGLHSNIQLPRNIEHIIIKYLSCIKFDDEYPFLKELEILDVRNCFDNNINIPKLHDKFIIHEQKYQDNIPNGVSHLHFSYFNEGIRKNSIPSSVTHIYFNRSYNKKINNLPNSITHIYMSKHFCRKIDKLPKNLVEFNNISKWCIRKNYDILKKHGIIKD